MTDNIYSKTGKLLYCGATTAATTHVNKTTTADMSANWVTEWIDMPPRGEGLCFEILYNGSPDTGSFTFFGRLVGPGFDLELTGIADTDGTSYAGDLDAANLELEALGTRLVNISGFVGQVQARYTAGSGTGDANVRVKVA